MRAGMSGVPAAIEISTVVADGLIQEHMRSRMYAMSEGGALDESIRTLIYLAAALADKVVQQHIHKTKVLETTHVARLAMATKMIGDAEPVFDALVGAQK